MHNDNAVLRKLNTVGSNACRGALIAAMTVSMMPTSAFAAAATAETGSEATNNAPISATKEETKSLNSEYSLSAVSDDATSGSTSYDLTKTLIINFIRTPPTFIRTCADECGNPIP